MSQARITISVDSLLKLPAGASYNKRSGQAGAEVSLRGDTIFVTATCDSLQREVEYYEELYYRAQDALEQCQNNLRTEQEWRSGLLAKLITLFFMGFVAGVLTTVTIILSKNRYGKK